MNAKLSPARLPGESFSDYKARRLEANKYVKERLRGRVVWNSQSQGTYRKEPK